MLRRGRPSIEFPWFCGLDRIPACLNQIGGILKRKLRQSNPNTHEKKNKKIVAQRRKNHRALANNETKSNENKKKCTRKQIHEPESFWEYRRVSFLACPYSSFYHKNDKTKHTLAILWNNAPFCALLHETENPKAKVAQISTDKRKTKMRHTTSSIAQHVCIYTIHRPSRISNGNNRHRQDTERESQRTEHRVQCFHSYSAILIVRKYYINVWNRDQKWSN